MILNSNGLTTTALPGLATDIGKPKPIFDDISIVIPTLGRPLLETSLHYMLAGTVWPSAIIVVDQGNKAEVQTWMEWIDRQGIHAQYIPSNQQGRAAGINRGLEQVATRFVAVTDDDCFVEANWLEKMVLNLRAAPNSIVTGRVEPAGNDEFCTVTSITPRIYNRPQLKAHPLIGGNMGSAMSLVERIGLFDEHPSIHAAEDSDWGYRALRLGIPIIYNPEVVVRHYSWRDPSQRAGRYRHYSRSQGGFYGKHLLHGDSLIAMQMMRDLIRGPLRWVRGMIKRDQDMIDRGQADTLELVPGIIIGLRHSRRAVLIRKAGNR